MTLYLKYRPQTISEIDLTSVREELQRILKSGRVPHAFLFAGPRGAGKTSAARILAKALNCEENAKRKTQNANIEPCNKCSQCVAITKGTSLDIIEIDAASNRGVDDIRSLREAVKLATSGAKKKVYIIDEAHMLTTEASNALLKTLEEPPEHVIFVLATTAPEKLLDTIKSRCTTLHFIKAGRDEVVRSLKRVIDGEKMKIEDGVLEEIAKIVDGSFREAHKILEQLSFGNETIKLEDVKRLSSMGTVDHRALIRSLAKKDTKSALGEIENVVSQGVPLRGYTAGVVGILRQSLLNALTDEKEDMEFKKEELLQLVELFQDAARAIPTSVIPQLPLEMAVIKYCVGEVEQSQSARLERNSPPASGADPARSRSRGLAAGELSTLDSTPQGLAQTSTPGARELTPTPLREGELEQKWKEIMRLTKTKNHSIEALLRATRPQSFDGKKLVVEVFYKFHKERLESQPHRSLVEEVAGQVLGGSTILVCILSGSPQKAVDLANISESVEEDIVKAAEEIFGGGTEDKLPN